MAIGSARVKIAGTSGWPSPFCCAKCFIERGWPLNEGFEVAGATILQSAEVDYLHDRMETAARTCRYSQGYSSTGAGSRSKGQCRGFIEESGCFIGRGRAYRSGEASKENDPQRLTCGIPLVIRQVQIKAVGRRIDRPGLPPCSIAQVRHCAAQLRRLRNLDAPPVSDVPCLHRSL